MQESPIQFVKRPTYKRIAKDRVVRLRYAVVDLADQRPLEYRDDLYYLHGGYGGAFPKVEGALEGKQVGDKIEIDLSPEEGYGPRVRELVMQVPEAHFPPDMRKIGARVEGEAADGHRVAFTVTAVDNGIITVDGNHPLAGRDLHLVLEVLDIRDAGTAELQAGYAFPPAPAEPPPGN